MPRYIDADMLREKMYHEAFEKDSQNQKWDSGCWIRYRMFENAVDSIPTADVVERKKGKWIHIKGLSESRVCSCCWAWLDWNMPRNSFCPNCGADMRKEKTND